MFAMLGQQLDCQCKAGLALQQHIPLLRNVANRTRIHRQQAWRGSRDPWALYGKAILDSPGRWLGGWYERQDRGIEGLETGTWVTRQRGNAALMVVA